MSLRVWWNQWRNRGVPPTPPRAPLVPIVVAPPTVELPIDIAPEITTPIIPYTAPLSNIDYPQGTLPVDGYVRKHSANLSLSWAIDVGVPEGTPVYAFATGIVSRVSDITDPWNGIGVWIRPTSGPVESGACIHLSRRLVELNAVVAKGQLIGFSGNTGNSRGPHLHFEIAPSVDPLDPTLFDWTDWQ